MIRMLYFHVSLPVGGSAEAAQQSWCMQDSARLRRILSKSWVVAVCCRSRLCPRAWPVLGTALWEGCINKQVQEEPSLSAGETPGFVMAACTALSTHWHSWLAHWASKNSRCAGLCCLGNGAVSLPSHWSGHHIWHSCQHAFNCF